jgi:glycosyltransferase involved in cell wall biosynthesis
MRAALRSLLWLPVRGVVYRRRFAGAAAILPIGTRNRRYYASFGVPDARMFEAKYCVENERFALGPTEREAARRRVRSALGLDPNAVLFVSAAKLIARKRPLDLLAAFAKLTLDRPELRVALLFLGDGPERPRLEEAIAAEGLGERVRISGFVNQSEIPAWYAASDCLVLPSDSQETWGLVVNEGMAAGLPVIVSDAVGCSPDLVEEGANGFTYPFADVRALADRMGRIAELDPERRAELGARSEEIVAGCTFATVADRVLEALAVVRGER